jgi:SLOG cluster3 family
MATKHLNKIFLSASIPSTDRDKKFYETADIIAIRDAVRALAAVVIPHAHLVWGGHPSITPLIRYVMERMNSDLKQHVTLYQSFFFKDKFPDDNYSFENIIHTESTGELNSSIEIMRQRMLGDNEFKAGVFIGGMEGIFNEYDLFKSLHPTALILPVASTGAASKIVYANSEAKLNSRLAGDYAYMALFRDLLSDFIN